MNLCHAFMFAIDLLYFHGHILHGDLSLYIIITIISCYNYCKDEQFRKERD